MTNNQIMKKALESPALKHKSAIKGKFAYPARFNDKVPLRVRMKETVTSDMDFMKRGQNAISCIQGSEYYVWVNHLGAVSAILDNGEQLGLKPHEFEVTEWHEQ